MNFATFNPKLLADVVFILGSNGNPLEVLFFGLPVALVWAKDNQTVIELELILKKLAV